MSAEAAFNALRAYKRELTGEGLSQSDVDTLNALFAKWQPRTSGNPTALADASKFFAAVRTAFGPLQQGQVEGIQTLLQAFGVASWPISWTAYGLATAWHETNGTVQPVREAYWLSEDWRKKNLRYYPWYGRGYVQCTWQQNYAHADQALGLNGALLEDPDIALRPDIASRITVLGMEQGWFCGKRLADYLPRTGEATEAAFALARHIINGTDQAPKIAGEALTFQKALRIGAWA